MSFCFKCSKTLYDILQKDGTENCKCESPDTTGDAEFQLLSLRVEFEYERARYEERIAELELKVAELSGRK